MNLVVLLVFVVFATTTALQCQTGNLTDLSNQILVGPLKTITCSNTNFCYTKYTSDGAEITYEYGCDENKICLVDGCTVNGLTKFCCCLTTEGCVNNGAVEPVEYSFPENFKFGVATASFQVEGGYNANGKGPSIWDIYTHKPNKITGNDTGDVACDSYHNYKRDVQMIKELGVAQYRFSISWPRIFPDGTTTKLNPDGVAYYNNLIDELIRNGIEPLVTMFHWDLPQYLQDLGGFLNEDIADKFAAYADFLFKTYGDRVKKWITLNEPLSVVTYAYCGKTTTHAPGTFREECEWTMYAAAHNLLRCHMKAANIYKKLYQWRQKGKVGITLSGAWYVPKDANNQADVSAAAKSFEFAFGWFAHPIFVGDYSPIIKDAVANNSMVFMQRVRSRLPQFTKSEINALKGSADFLGVNYYLAFESRGMTETEKKAMFYDFKRTDDWGAINGYKDSWRLINTTRPWIVYTPDGLRLVLKKLKENYGNIPMIITENGCMDSDNDSPLNDTERIRYLRGHLTAVSRAINEDHVNVLGYHAWSLMDNFEWTDGYHTRFGLYRVDFTDPNRTRVQKESAKFYSQIVNLKKVMGFSPSQYH